MNAADWESISLAGAFIIGAILGVVAAIRMMRVISGAFRAERRKDEDQTAR